MIIEIKNSLDRLNSKLEMVEERISEHKDQSIEISNVNNREKIDLKKKKKKNSVSGTCGTITKKSNICTTGVSEKEEKEYESEKNIWGKMAENNFF